MNCFQKIKYLIKFNKVHYLMDVCEEEQGSHLMVPSNGKSGILLLQLVLQTMAPWLWSPGVPDLGEITCFTCHLWLFNNDG
uniref:Uncharacterized protein n=1 Tax=Anguilla anguilla TaxID=7936 RepID=A0A0E9XKE3_ANGAN